MAEGEVVAREAVLLRSKDERDATAPFQFKADQRREIGEKNHALFGLAVGQRSCADDQGAGCNGVGEGGMLLRVFKEIRRSDGGPGFSPVGFERSDYGQMRKAEVRHGPRRCANVERVAGRDKHDVEAVALEIDEQEMIVERTETKRRVRGVVDGAANPDCLVHRGRAQTAGARNAAVRLRGDENVSLRK